MSRGGYSSAGGQRRKPVSIAEMGDRSLEEFASLCGGWFWETDRNHRFTALLGNAFVDPRVSVAQALGLSRVELMRCMGVPVTASALALEAAMDRLESFHGFYLERGASTDATGHDVFLLSGRPVFGSDGRFIGYRGFGRDVTAEKASSSRMAAVQAASRRQLEACRTAIAIASHELRTPLAVIDSTAQRLAMRYRADDPDGRRVARLGAAVARAVGIIDRILEPARQGHGGPQLERAPCDLGATLRRLCQEESELDPSFRIDLRAPSRGPSVDLDPAFLEIILSNLLSNARKYSGASRQIEVTLDSDGQVGWIEIAVRDFGIGIDAADLPHVFDRHFRAAAVRGIPGQGLGLEIVRALVQSQGGSVSVISAPGAGSTFRVRLPHAPAG